MHDSSMALLPAPAHEAATPAPLPRGSRTQRQDPVPKFPAPGEPMEPTAGATRLELVGQ